MICPVTKRVKEKKKIILNRYYPGKCKLVVKIGQSVGDTDIIGHCEVSAGRRLIKIAHVLGVSGAAVQKYLTRRVGEKIYEGEILARRKGVLGLGKKEIKAPVDGLITEIDARGDLILQFLPKPVRLLAGASGKIKAVDDKKIAIETIATQIHGFVSIGKEREGIISIVGNPKEFILPTRITQEAKGKILVGGALLEKGALEKAVTLGAVGIITGGMNYRDFESLGGGEDFGISIIVTEGFGTAPMGDDIFNYLSQRQGRFGFILGSENKLILPDLEEPAEVRELSTPTQVWRELSVGDKVRYLRKESGDLLGVVKELPGEQIINSGILAQVAKVAFNSKQELLLPAANLEIIE
ncbi:MAG: hypothetical protein WD187_00685 [Candidatus Woykebacteria bacterium]